MADNYSSKEPDLISKLPDELLVHILENLCYCQFDKVSQVSTRFNNLSNLSKEQNLTQKMMNGMDSSSQSKVHPKPDISTTLPESENICQKIISDIIGHERYKYLILG